MGYKSTQSDSLKELTARIENGLKQTFDDFTKITSNILEEQLKSISNTSDSFSDGVEVVKKQLQPQDPTPAIKVSTTKTPTAKPPVRFFCPCCRVEMVKIGKITPKRGPPI